MSDDKFKKRAIYQNFNCVDCGSSVRNVAHKQTMPICIVCFKLLERAREIAADDVSAMTASWVDTQAFARALISFPRVEEVRREALEKAAEQFEFYALEHRQKSLNSRGNGLDAAADASHEKAIINMGMANMCRSALSLQVEGTKP